MSFWKCFAYLATVGVLSHFFGQALPRRWFIANSFPWCSFRWERNGKIYDRIAIRKWKDKLPDMSRIMPDMVPKRILPQSQPGDIDLLIRETCVAELTHAVLMIAGFFCVHIWNAVGGWIVSILFALGNVPFVWIQRYNRPRFVRLYDWMIAKEQAGGEVNAVGQA